MGSEDRESSFLNILWTHEKEEPFLKTIAEYTRPDQECRIEFENAVIFANDEGLLTSFTEAACAAVIERRIKDFTFSAAAVGRAIKFLKTEKHPLSANQEAPELSLSMFLDLVTVARDRNRSDDFYSHALESCGLFGGYSILLKMYLCGANEAVTKEAVAKEGGQNCELFKPFLDVVAKVREMQSKEQYLLSLFLAASTECTKDELQWQQQNKQHQKSLFERFMNVIASIINLRLDDNDKNSFLENFFCFTIDAQQKIEKKENSNYVELYKYIFLADSAPEGYTLQCLLPKPMSPTHE